MRAAASRGAGLSAQFGNAEEAELSLFLLAQECGQGSAYHVIIGIGYNGMEEKDIDVIGTQSVQRIVQPGDDLLRR